MVLYRPFIHTIIRAESKDVPEMRSFACASACIKAAMQIIWIVSELSNHGLLVSAYWFTDYITFFAVMVLCMFIIGNPDDPTVEETIMAAEKGRNILSGLAHESLLAGKCLASLGVRGSPPILPLQFLIVLILTLGLVSIRSDRFAMHRASPFSQLGHKQKRR